MHTSRRSIDIPFSITALQGGLPAADRELLYALCAGLIRRFDGTHADWLECIGTLSSYPADLLCAGYYHLHRRDTLTGGTTIAQCMRSFMDPEFQHRNRHLLQSAMTAGHTI